MRAPESVGDDHPAETSLSGAARPLDGQRGALSFGRQLRRLRLRAGLTQEVLAERSGVSVATIGALEEDRRRRPYPSTVAALATALDLAPAERTSLVELASVSSAEAVAPARSPATTGSSGVTARVRLPAPPTPLIGRAAEVATARSMLDPTSSTVRLLTLVGPGGVGKTRLALAVAAALIDAYADGVVFVDLAPLRDERLVPSTIAYALELRESGGGSARELLLAHLQGRQLLLVLDNFEHLLGAAPLLAELLEACPRVALLATSRTALRLRPEQRFRVAPLATAPASASATPPSTDEASHPGLAVAPAALLFAARAQTAAPEFVLDETTAPAVTAICERLEGMPLAIELAAARAGLLRPDALLRRLERRLPLLIGGAADLPERQQTLRQTLAWSHDLLGADEQRLFRRLAVFAGGWTLDAAEAVCGAADLPAEDVLDRLAMLVDHSLVHQADEPSAEPRFGMLETVREFAQEQLAAHSEEGTMRQAHARYVAELIEDMAPRLAGPVQREWIRRMLAEWENVRAALTWLLRTGEFDTVGRLLRWVDRFWWATGQIAEARYWGEHVLAYDSQVPPVTRARALFIVGSTAMLQGDNRAEKVLGEGRALGQAANDPWAEGFCLLCLGALAPLRGDVAGGTDLLWQAQARLREAADDWAVGMTWGGLSALALAVGQFDEAERFAQEHLALARAAGDLLGMTQGWDELALVSLVRQDQDQAAVRLREEIVLALEVGQPEHIASGLDGLALVAASTQPARAAREFGAAEALRQAHGLAVLPTRRPLYEPALQALRAALGTSAFAAAWAEGQAMPREQAVAYALEQATALSN